MSDKTCVINKELWNIQTKPIEDSVLKSAYGVGFYSDEENLLFDSINSKCNDIWRRMLALCNSIAPSFEQQRRSREYTICNEWYDYNNFKTWYDENYYELENETICFSCMCIKKNNTHFCPQLCAFVPQSIIGLLYGASNAIDSNDCACGVSIENRNKGKVYKCMMKIAPELNCGSPNFYIGSYDTEEEAFMNYKIVKELYIKGVAYHYKDKIPSKLYNAMINWIVEKDDNKIAYENSNTRKNVFRL